MFSELESFFRFQYPCLVCDDCPLCVGQLYSPTASNRKLGSYPNNYCPTTQGPQLKVSPTISEPNRVSACRLLSYDRIKTVCRWCSMGDYCAVVRVLFFACSWSCLRTLCSVLPFLCFSICGKSAVIIQVFVDQSHFPKR